MFQGRVFKSKDQAKKGWFNKPISILSSTLGGLLGMETLQDLERELNMR